MSYPHVASKAEHPHLKFIGAMHNGGSSGAREAVVVCLSQTTQRRYSGAHKIVLSKICSMVSHTIERNIIHRVW